MSSSEESDNLIYSRTIREADKRTPRKLYLLTALGGLGGFLFGYDTGVISGAMILIRKEFRISDSWHELIVSATIVGAFWFSLLAGQLSDRYGRKPVILTSSVAFTVGSFLVGLSPGPITLLVGRLTLGIGVGLASMAVPVYIAETVSSENRGQLVTLYNVLITGGQFVAAVICGIFSEVEEGWRYMLGAAVIPALIQFFGFIAMPESPRFLVKKGDFAQAVNVLKQVRSPNSNIYGELEDIKVSFFEEEKFNEQSGIGNILRQVFKQPFVKKALVLGCLLQLFQQISGINTIMYYSASIIQMTGITSSNAVIWLACLTSAFNFISTFIGLYFVDRKGRRPLLLFSMAGVTACLFFLGISFSTRVEIPMGVDHCQAEPMFTSCSTCVGSRLCGFCHNSTQGTCLSADKASECAYNWSTDACPSMNQVSSVLTVIGLCLYLLSFSPGLGPLPWTINSEIYPLWARSTCNSVATSVNWAANLLVSSTFLSVINGIGRGTTFFLYGTMSFVGFIIFYFTLPETKEIALEEMESVFSSRRKVARYSKIQSTSFEE